MDAFLALPDLHNDPALAAIIERRVAKQIALERTQMRAQARAATLTWISIAFLAGLALGWMILGTFVPFLWLIIQGAAGGP